VLARAAADDQDLHRCEVNSLPDKGLERSEMERKRGSERRARTGNFLPLISLT